MQSLFKAVHVNPTEKRSIPLPVIKAPVEERAEEEARLTEQEIEAQVNTRVEAQLKIFLQEERQRAEKEIASERQKLTAEIEKQRQDTQKKAQEEGYSEGLKLAHSEAEKLMAEIRAAEQQNIRGREEFIESCKGEITQLIISGTQAVLKLELESTEQVIALINRAIDDLVSKKKIVVYVHPSRYDEVVAHTYLFPNTEDGRDVLFRVEPTLGSQVFRVEDDRGSVVVDLPQDLKLLAQVLQRE